MSAVHMCPDVKKCRRRVGNVGDVSGMLFSRRHHFLPCRRHVGVSAFLTLLPISQTATFPAKAEINMFQVAREKEILKR